MQAVVHEIRQALYQLRRHPGFTLVAAGILGLGLAATLYMFTVLKAYMLTPLPFPDADRIMHIETANTLAGADSLEVRPHDFVDWRRVQTSFENLSAFYTGTVNLSGGELPERFEGAFITPSAFDVVEVEALVGRTLVPEDGLPGAAPVVVLGYDLWLYRYDGDTALIGETVRVNGIPTTVVGVMPRGFRFPLAHELWLPLPLDLGGLARGEGTTLEVFGRLKPGVTLEQARAEFANIAQALAGQYPENRNVTTVLKPFQHEYIPADARQTIAAMFGAVILVLLIACANVANLILARTAVRQRDMALRAALGASRWRIMVHVLTESVVLAALGAIMAWFLAGAGLDLTERAFLVADIEEPFWVAFELDGRVLAFATFAAVAAGIVAGLAPGLRATRTDVNAHLKEGPKGSGASASRLSRSLVTAEIALSCVLLVAAGLMIRSVVNSSERPLGIGNTELLTGRIRLPDAQYPDPAAQFGFFEALAEKLNAHPEVVGATVAYSFPGMRGWTAPYSTRDSVPPGDGPLPATSYAGVLNNYAEVLDLELSSGRWFDAREHAASEPVIVIDRVFAETAFPDGDALGRQVLLGDPDDANSRWHTVIGVTGQTTLDELDNPEQPAAFVPLVQVPQPFLTVAVHTRGAPLEFSQTLRETVRELDPDIPVYWVRTLEDWLWAGNFTSRVVSTLFGLFAFIAVALSAAGIYSVLAYSVSQRTREIGVRRALGALDGRILNMIVKQGAEQLAIGLACGLVFAIGFAHLLSSILIGVSPFDPPTLAGVALLLCLVAVLASLVPALRAMRVNPMDALRYE